MSKAISVEPTGDFDGNDGKWSTFAIGIGTPPQTVKLLVATSGQETWVVTPDACFEDDAACRNGRGYLYNASASSTWEEEGFYELSDQANLGYNGTGYYGFDTVQLGWPGSGGASINRSVIAGTSSEDFYLGLFGVSPRPTNFTNFNDGEPSFLTLLKEKGDISTLSYGYNAGARYQGTNAQGSLTLGGYDLSRFAPNNATFTFSSVTYRDLVVPISSITGKSNSSPQINLLSKEIVAMVDGGTPHIWLPMDACKSFEENFGLIYDETSNLYLVNDTLHEELSSQNISLSFELRSSTEEKVVISLPYEAFDLEVDSTYPNITNSSRYFPLRRAANDTQYTLGRTFLQEAYMIVDYERGNFSIHQARWDLVNRQAQANIIAIDPPVNITQQDSGAKKTPTTTIIGAAVGGGVGLLLICALIAFWFIRKRRRARNGSVATDETPNAELQNDAKHELETGIDRAEMYAGMRAEFEGDHFQAELSGDGALKAEMDAAEKLRIYEMDAAALKPQELQGEGMQIAELDATPKKPGEIG